MVRSSPDSEAALEHTTLALFSSLGWKTVNAFDEVFDPEQDAPTRPYLGREHRGRVVLLDRLRAAKWTRHSWTLTWEG